LKVPRCGLEAATSHPLDTAFLFARAHKEVWSNGPKVTHMVGGYAGGRKPPAIKTGDSVHSHPLFTMHRSNSTYEG